MTSNNAVSSSILDAIKHYQRNIERSQSQNDEQRLLHCINKLYKMPVKVEHLQETGVGKTVNSLRKYNGEIGVAAKALVNKWKAMVAAEEEKEDEPMEVSYQRRDDDDNNNVNGESDKSSDEEQREPLAAAASSHKTTNPTQDAPRNNDANEQSKSTSSHDKSKYNRSHRNDRNEQQSSDGNRDHHHQEKKSHGKDKTDERRRSDATQIVKDSRRRPGEHHATSSTPSTSTAASKEKHRHEKDNGSVEEENTNKKKSSTSSHHKSSHAKKQEDDKHHKSSSSGRHHSSKERSDHNREHEKNGGKHKERSSEKATHHSTSSSTKDNSNKRDDNKKEKSQPPTSSSSSSNAKKTEHRKSHSSHSSNEHKRQHNSDNDSNNDDGASPPTDAKLTSRPAKMPKLSVEEKAPNDADDGIDSSTGANFADVLGMLNLPTKKSKKSLQLVVSNAATTTTTTPATTNANSAKSASGSSSSKEYTASKLNGVKSASSTTPIKTTNAKPNPTAKPELLSSSAKLEPLDPSIALELPTISNNYKPMPLNQTVMDCVFNTSTSSSSKTPAMRTLTDAEALSHGISSKTMRTKIYSGVKTGQKLQVPTLFDLCIRILQKNIDALEYTGGVPFEVLRPVLERATPQQLLIFEDYNPYVMEDSDVLWKQHLQRNYRTQKRQEMETWREMYLRCQDEEERRLNILAENIKQSQKIIAAPVRKTQLAFVDSMVKPPRNVLRKQEQYGTKGKLIATPASRVAALSSVTPNAAKVGDVRLRVAAGVRDAAQVAHAPIRPKKAPLMAKTLQLMRGRHKR